jgi:PadR family transcriptional regulator PadR
MITTISDTSEFEVITIPVGRELLKGSMPTLVLSVLSRAPMHGYQMVKELQHLSTGVLTFKEGTLYPILHTMEGDGLITAHWESDGGRERKVYHLTDQGRGELRRRVAEWTEFRSAIDTVLQGGNFTYVCA